MLETISGREYPIKVIPLIQNAKSSIDIVVFDWRWYPQDPGASCQLFNQAIIQSIRRGVKIRAIVNNGRIMDILLREGCFVKKLMTTKLVHCKLMIIDEQIVITGSHNYSQSAFQLNLELSVIINENGIVKDFSNFFNNLWN